MYEPAIQTRFPALEEKLAAKHSALLIVDVQNDFCDPNGFYCHVPEYSQTELAPVNRMRGPLLALLEAARAADCLRVFIRGIYDPVYVAPPFGEKLASRGALGHACLEGSWGADYWAPFRPQESSREVEVIKHRNSAFHGTDLAVILRANGIRTTVITGVATSGCVDSTVRHAMFNDFFVILAADATADYVEERYRVHVDTIAARSLSSSVLARPPISTSICIVGCSTGSFGAPRANRISRKRARPPVPSSRAYSTRSSRAS